MADLAGVRVQDFGFLDASFVSVGPSMERRRKGSGVCKAQGAIADLAGKLSAMIDSRFLMC